MRGDDFAVDAVWAVSAGVVSFALAVAGHELLRVPALERTNYAGRAIPTAGGIFAVLALFVVTAIANSADPVEFGLSTRVAWLVGSFAVLGLFDDVVGNASARGLRGHVAAARRGQLTSGVVKLVFGVVIAWSVIEPRVDTARHIAATILVAGCANVANLLDLAPARATKVALLVFLALVVFANDTLVAGEYWFVVAIAGLMVFELRESLMLGDTGANPLGATIGFMLAGSLQESVLAMWLAAIVVLAINAAAEFVSFSRIIERVAPLRVFDQLGRRR
jgi:UDP-N-acetylmuramyl pentapeptide phosphotransferase/UDP-N-acetylglucosamine-1-phosphate transferase